MIVIRFIVNSRCRSAQRWESMMQDGAGSTSKARAGEKAEKPSICSRENSYLHIINEIILQSMTHRPRMRTIP